MGARVAGGTVTGSVASHIEISDFRQRTEDSQACANNKSRRFFFCCLFGFLLLLFLGGRALTNISGFNCFGMCKKSTY